MSPSRTPAAPETRVDTTQPQSPDDPGHAGKLPHERDQSPDAAPHHPVPR